MRFGWPLLSLLLASQGGCIPLDGGFHRRGEGTLAARAFHADPIVGKALAWEGEANLPSNGYGGQLHWYWEDRLAAGIGANWSRFQVEHGHVRSRDLELRLRYHVAEMDKAGLFVDLLGGVMVAEKPLPPEGTRRNYTFGGGAGLEFKLFTDWSLLVGTEFHHMSNARGRNASDNPSQNEFLVWSGLGFRW